MLFLTEHDSKDTLHTNLYFPALIIYLSIAEFCLKTCNSIMDLLPAENYPGETMKH